MAELKKDELEALARLGAQARLAELAEEIAALTAAFPDLAAPRKAARAKAAPAPQPARQRRKERKPYRMSPAKRKAQADRMKAYWAARRQEKAAAQPPAEANDKPPRRRSSRKTD